MKTPRITDTEVVENKLASAPLLEVRNLGVQFGSGERAIKAVDGVSFSVYPGETLGIVGESGSGKSVSVMSLLGLIPDRDENPVSGTAVFDGQDLLKLSQRELREIRGNEIGMVFQDAMTALNPVLSIGDQLCEALTVHRRLPAKAARSKAVSLLESVGVPEAETRLNQYPHEYSGGMRQRAMIAMAIANDPKLLIADEPTTALDVTIQAQVLDVLRKAKEETGAATIIITHDLGVVAEMADRVAVIYAGQVVEIGLVEQVFKKPAHPYTVGLLASLPRLDGGSAPLVPIPGNPPAPGEVLIGCRFEPRCNLSRGRSECRTANPELIAVEPWVEARCHFADEVQQYATAKLSLEGGVDGYANQ